MSLTQSVIPVSRCGHLLVVAPTATMRENPDLVSRMPVSLLQDCDGVEQLTQSTPDFGIRCGTAGVAVHDMAFSLLL